MAKNGKPAEIAKVNKLVRQYRDLRVRIEEIEEAHKRQLKPFKEARDKLAGTMLEFLDKTGQEMARTDEGTVYVLVKHTTPLGDPDAFMAYVMKNGAFELMDRRANSTACREFAEEHGSLPPGVKLNTTRTVGVRSE